MKILVHGFRDQPMYSLFNHLTSCLQSSGKNRVFFSNQENPSDLNAVTQVVQEIGPDVLIFNKKTKLTTKNKARSLYIDVAKLDPFAYLPQSEQESSSMYACDVVYIGNPMVFGDGLQVLTESDFVFKFFEKRPAFVSGYCGSLKGSSVGQDVIIRSAKAAITMPTDKYRLLNIIASNGNPVVFQDPQQLQQDIRSAIKGVKFFGGISRSEVISNHTSHDRMIEFIKKVGLDNLLDVLIRNKNVAWGAA